MTGLEKRILALAPEEAVRVLEEVGLKVEVLETGPPRFNALAAGEARVVRLRVRGGAGYITVAREQSKQLKT